jgi:hypothetical protein
MRLVTKLGIGLCFAAVLSYAENWTGKLVDASCMDKNVPPTATDSKAHEKAAETCKATSSTTSFAIMTSDGKVYKFDSAGNTKAAGEFKNATLKPDKDGDVHVNVSGSLEGADNVKVEAITAGRPRG